MDNAVKQALNGDCGICYEPLGASNDANKGDIAVCPQCDALMCSDCSLKFQQLKRPAKLRAGCPFCRYGSDSRRYDAAGRLINTEFDMQRVVLPKSAKVYQFLDRLQQFSRATTRFYVNDKPLPGGIASLDSAAMFAEFTALVLDQWDDIVKPLRRKIHERLEARIDADKRYFSHVLSRRPPKKGPPASPEKIAFLLDRWPPFIELVKQCRDALPPV